MKMSYIGIMGSNPIRDMDACVCVCGVLCKVAALLLSSHPCKESYGLSIRFVISELILKRNRPEGLIQKVL
jgi:hypothetical protein